MGQEPTHSTPCSPFAYYRGSLSSHKRDLPAVDVPTLLLGEDVISVGVAVTEVASKIRGRLRVRNLKIPGKG